MRSPMLTLRVASLLTVLGSGLGAQVRTPIGTVTSTAGPPPTGVRAVATTHSSVTVSWDAIAGVQGFVVTRRQTSDPACCVRMSGRLLATSWVDDALKASTQYTFQVSVTYTDGSSGAAEVSVTTPAPAVPGPIPATYGGTVNGNVVTVSWSAVTEASEFSVIRNGAEVARGAACLQTCSINDTGIYGTTHAYVIESRFPAGSNMSSSRTPTFSVPIPHLISLQPTAYLIARGSRVDFQISNTANPDGLRGGLVSGSGKGVTVTDPGMNKLAMHSAPNAPLGVQRIQLTAANTTPAFVDAVVMRTPGQAALALTGIASLTKPSGATLRVEQLSGNRWGATFNALPRVEFERDGNFGGATFCATSDAVGVVMTANGRRAGVSSPWAIVLQELDRTPVPAAHLLEARRLSPDGRIGLVPLVFLTPDCTLAVIVDVSDNAAMPYRLRMYDLLARQFLGSVNFAAPEVMYTSVRAELFPGDPTAMLLLTAYPGATSRIPIPHRSY